LLHSSSAEGPSPLLPSVDSLDPELLSLGLGLGLTLPPLSDPPVDEEEEEEEEDDEDDEDEDDEDDEDEDEGSTVISHSVPVYISGQTHTKLPTPSMHIPFIQGSSSHIFVRRLQLLPPYPAVHKQE